MIFKEIILLLLWAKGKISPPRIIPLLNYHSIDDSGSPISTSSEDFRGQMEYLKAQGYTAISLPRILEFYAQGNIPSRTVGITFDDGYRNNYTYAFPILKGLGFTATIFLVTDFIGGKWKWGKEEGLPELNMLSWEEVREMGEEGLDFGAHTLSHPHLTDLTPEEARREVNLSKEVIQSQLNKRVEFFAYPYGDFNSEVISLVKKAGYTGACTTYPLLPKGPLSPFQLPRLDINRFSGNPPFISRLFFKTCLVGTFGYYLQLKGRIPWIKKRTFEYQEEERKKNAISSTIY